MSCADQGTFVRGRGPDPEVIKLFSMLNSAEFESSTAHDNLCAKKSFTAFKLSNTAFFMLINVKCHFNI